MPTGQRWNAGKGVGMQLLTAQCPYIAASLSRCTCNERHVL